MKNTSVKFVIQKLMKNMPSLYNLNTSFLETKSALLLKIVQKAKDLGKPTKGLNDPDNFIIAGGIRYYLTTDHWQEIYQLMLDENKHTISKIPKILERDEKLKINFLSSNIKKTLASLRERPNLRSENLTQMMLRFCKRILVEDMFYTNVIYDDLYHRIHLASITNKLDENTDRFMEKETILSFSIGKKIFQSFLRNTKVYQLLFDSKEETMHTNSKEFQLLTEIVETLLNYYKNLEEIPKNLTVEMREIKQIYTQEFFLEFSDIEIFHLFNVQLLIMAINRTNKPNVNHVTYTWVLPIYTSPDIKKYLEPFLTKYYVVLGSLIINELCQEEVFILITKHHQGKNINYVQFNNTITETLFVSGSYFKQPLIVENLKHSSFKQILMEVSNENEDNIFIEVSFEKHLEQVHDNLTGKGELKFTSALQNSEKILYTRTSIDPIFLASFLEYFLQISKDIDQILLSDKEQLMLYFSLYTLDIIKMYNNIPKEFHTILDKIVIFALNLRHLSDSELHQEITSILEEKYRAQLKIYYYQIKAYKFMIRQVILESIVYSAFGYFLNLSFFDFRGRRYFSNPNFTLQGYSFIKAFVKLYEICPQSQFDLIKENVLDSIKNKPIKEEVSLLFCDSKSYVNHIQNNINDFLYIFFDENKICKESFVAFINKQKKSFLEISKFVLANVKKNKRALMLISYILLEQERIDTPIYFANNYSYDAVVSGYQMISILFRSHSLGRLCNLVGKDKKDIYQEAQNQFQKTLKLFFTCLQIVVSDILNTSYDILYEMIEQKELLNLEDFRSSSSDILIKIFLTKNLNSKERAIILPIIFSDKTFQKYIKKFKFSHEFFAFAESKLMYIECKTLVKDSLFVSNLIVLREILHLKYFISKNPWILEKNVLQSRDLFKNAIMIQIYGGTSQGRQAGFRKFFKEHALELGVQLDSKALASVCHFLEAFFSTYKKLHLGETSDLTATSKILSSQNKPIIIDNQHFTITLEPHKQKKEAVRILIRTMTGRKPYRLTVHSDQIFTDKISAKKTLILDKKKLVSLFPPDFIHSMDASLVHAFMVRCLHLNKIFNCHGIYFNEITTHDNFTLGRFLFPFLRYILKDLYLELYHSNYLITTLKGNIPEEALNKIRALCKTEEDSNYLKTPFDNPHFIKYG